MGLIASQTKIWVGKSRKLCNRSMKLLLKKNYIQIILKEKLLLLKDLLEP